MNQKINIKTAIIEDYDNCNHEISRQFFRFILEELKKEKGGNESVDAIQKSA